MKAEFPSSQIGRILALTFWLALSPSSLTSPLLAQTTVDTGSIVGTVSDPSRSLWSAGLRSASPIAATGQVIDLTTNSSGAFNSGALVPGNYKTQVSAKSFTSVVVPVTVLVGNTATVNVTCKSGKRRQLIEVQRVRRASKHGATHGAGCLECGTDREPASERPQFPRLGATGAGRSNSGRSDGFGFKDGYSSISFGGRFGRTARIEVDGIDISDERFGSSTTNIPASGIQEFQLSQSSLDLSTELTTSGAVNVTTRSGTNDTHGEAFGFFRDSSLAAALPAPPGLSEPFQRSQYGGRVGGPVVRNKFFYFLDGERTLQHEQAPVLVAAPFRAIFRQLQRRHSTKTTSWQRPIISLRTLSHAFYRFGYFQNSFTSNGGFGFSLYNGKNITRTHMAGFDFNTGSFSHSIRFGYLKTGRDTSMEPAARSAAGQLPVKHTDGLYGDC